MKPAGSLPFILLPASQGYQKQIIYNQMQLIRILFHSPYKGDKSKCQIKRGNNLQQVWYMGLHSLQLYSVLPYQTIRSLAQSRMRYSNAHPFFGTHNSLFHTSHKTQHHMNISFARNFFSALI